MGSTVTAGEHRFATAVTCMDGRIQHAVVDWARREFAVDYVDMVTVPGVDRILATDRRGCLRVVSDLEMSRQAHGSRHVVVASHADCAGNPVPDVEHERMVRDGMAWLANQFPDMTIVGVHVDIDGADIRLVHQQAQSSPGT